MSRFFAVTGQEMDEFLTKRGFVKLVLAGVNETVYGRQMGNGYTLAVFTGVEDGVSRKSGDDAIRVSLMHSGRVLTSLPHVKRLKTWRENLTERFRDWKSMACELPCPLCGGLLLLRKSKRGKFYGCAKYPTCKGTREQS